MNTASFAARAVPLVVMPLLLDGIPPLPERESVGLKLRAARKKAGIETVKAAELGGISVAQLGNIERGSHSLTWSSQLANDKHVPSKSLDRFSTNPQGAWKRTFV